MTCLLGLQYIEEDTITLELDILEEFHCFNKKRKK